jgi:hypothetical protein
MQQTDKISARMPPRMSPRHGMAHIAPQGRREKFDEKIRAGDIVVALAGCWVLLAIIIYMLLAAPGANAHSGATVTLMPSVASEQTI